MVYTPLLTSEDKYQLGHPLGSTPTDQEFGPFLPRLSASVNLTSILSNTFWTLDFSPSMTFLSTKDDPSFGNSYTTSDFSPSMTHQTSRCSFQLKTTSCCKIPLVEDNDLDQTLYSSTSHRWVCKASCG